MRVYLAGPMSGIPQSNFPAFHKAAAALRAAGYDVVSPAEMDDPETVALVMANLPVKQTWGDFLSRDVKLIADGGIEGIVFLPDWMHSRGARLEAFVGLLSSPTFQFFQFVNPGVRKIDRNKVMDYIWSVTV